MFRMRILVIGAHADDIEPQMGGTIARYVDKGHEVKMVEAVVPCENENGIACSESKALRWKEAEKAADILGADLEILDLDPYDLVKSRNLVQILDKVVREYNPDVVYTNWNHDSHQDHTAISNATFAATRKNLGTLYMYGHAAPGGLTPFVFNEQAFVDITGYIGKKLDSVSAYASQVKRYDNWVKAIESRSRYIGFMIKTEYAEAFEVVRLIKMI